MSETIRLTFDQASDARILALAHRRARESGAGVTIDPPTRAVVWLTREQAADREQYDRALASVRGDCTRIRLRPE